MAGDEPDESARSAPQRRAPESKPRRALARRGAVRFVTSAYGQPEANCCWKQMKSLTLRTGAAVEPSQLA